MFSLTTNIRHSMESLNKNLFLKHIIKCGETVTQTCAGHQDLFNWKALIPIPSIIKMNHFHLLPLSKNQYFPNKSFIYEIVSNKNSLEKPINPQTKFYCRSRTLKILFLQKQEKHENLVNSLSLNKQ